MFKLLRSCHCVLKAGGVRRLNLISAANSVVNMSTTTDSQEAASTLKFLEDVHNIMVNSNYIEKCGSDSSTKVTQFLQPAQLMEKMEYDISEEGTPNDKLLDLCKRAIQYSVKAGHPRFFNQLYNGVDPYALAGGWITEVLNTNVHTFEVAPVFVTAEHYMVKKISELVGYPDGDGLFCPGGTFSNYIALHLARYTYDKNIKQTGMQGAPKFHLYVSEEGHYSMQKGASFLGFGIQSVVKIPTDVGGSVIPEEFEKKVLESKEQGAVPLFFMATAGTTVLGSFDALNPLADICEKYGIWLHVDAAWGGGALVSKKHRPLMAGSHRTNSLAWCLHKMPRAGIQCSILVLQQKDLLAECNSAHAEYLFQPDKCYDTSYDIGDKSLQCGRKGDALKAWLMWKAKGDRGMEEEMDLAMDNAQLFLKKLKEREGFLPILPEFQFTNVGFWYIPPSLRGQEQTEEWWKKLSKVAPEIKQRMMHCGSMMIAYQPLSRTNKPFVNFFRIIIKHVDTTASELDFIINEIERLGKDL